MTKVAVVDKSGKEVDKVEFPADFFGKRVNTRVIHQAVVKYHASLRQGTANTKDRGEVSGGGRKPFKQKGTGQARAGSTRSPLRVGGGVTFGPRYRDFSYTIPKKVKKAALKESLYAKIVSEDLLCLSDLSDSFSKTKEFAQILKNLKITGKTLAVLDGCDKSIYRVGNNIPRFNIMRSVDINAFDVMKNKKLLISKTGLQQLIDRIQSSAAKEDK